MLLNRSVSHSCSHSSVTSSTTPVESTLLELIVLGGHDTHAQASFGSGTQVVQGGIQVVVPHSGGAILQEGGSIEGSHAFLYPTHSKTSQP